MTSHTDGYILFSADCKHGPCSTLTHSTNEDLPNIKRKGDTKSLTLSRTSDTSNLYASNWKSSYDINDVMLVMCQSRQ